MSMLALTRTAPLAIVLIGLTPAVQSQETPTTRPVDQIHSLTDISHEFTFYFDGRFAKNYISDNGVDARNWATLHKADLSNVNLLILQSGASPCPYLPRDVAAVRGFLEDGGGVAVLGNFALFRDERAYRLNELARHFGAEFTKQPAQTPLRGKRALRARRIECSGGKTIRLAEPAEWEILVEDADGQVLLARRTVGKGRLLVASRSLCGSRPDAADPINAEWWQPLLMDLSSGKPIDPARPPASRMPENTVVKSGLRLRYSDYMEPYADAIFEVYTRCRPAMERILGVPPSKDMLTSIILLPTGGGGFSSGREIGLGVWWGDFPRRQYGMVELLGHEATHSWVLPFAEPMWNEGLATYIGILLGRELGVTDEANATLKRWLDAAREHDPDMTKYDLARGRNIPHAVAMAKPMWIFEQLRGERPDIIARYMQAKRRLVDPEQVTEYTADDCVAVLSHAMGRDLFPWFQSLGIRVDAASTSLDVPVP
jgi:hypothetical protein